MNVGFVSNWCNRGQGVLTRWFRSIFDEAGHNTFVLARPTNPNAPIPNFVDERDDWQADNVTQGSAFDMPKEEYVAWAQQCDLDVLFCDMNLQFEEVAAVRALGVRTIGRFVWERFGKGYVTSVNNAYDVVYSLTRAEQAVYKNFGIESPYLRLGIHPSLKQTSHPKRDDAIYFLFHGGLQGLRKPLKATIDVFKRVDNPNIRLIIKSQGVREESEPVEVDDDPRIQHIVEDMDDDQYHALFSSCHVCLSPSRWEGLGVHLYESIAHGMPVISNDIPPINEVITDGQTGLLVKSIPLRTKSNGLVIYDPEHEHLKICIEQLSDIERLNRMIETTKSIADSDRFSWDNTCADYLAIASGTTPRRSFLNSLFRKHH